MIRLLRLIFRWGGAFPPGTGGVILDTLYRNTGGKWEGTLRISLTDNTDSTKATFATFVRLYLVTSGAVSLTLEPNANLTPAGTVYRVVYRGNDGARAMEYWTVPTTTGTTIRAIRVP